MSSSPDLTTLVVLHRTMRRDARRFADAVARVCELDRTVRVPALRRWYAGFQAELHDHHVIEDEIFFPALVERVPAAGALIGRVDADHDRLGYLLGRIGVVLERLANPHVSFRLAYAEAVMLTDGLHALLESHLGFEDEEIVPLFERHFSASQHEELETQARRRVVLRQLLFTVPWAMEGAETEEQQHLMDTVPFTFKVIWYATRGRYRRLASAAFDAPAVAALSAG
jgi:hemerythrin HHE cation binding domain-containing protein